MWYNEYNERRYMSITAYSTKGYESMKREKQILKALKMVNVLNYLVSTLDINELKKRGL